MTIKIREYTQRDKTVLEKSYGKLQDYLVEIDPLKRLRREVGYVEYNVDKLLKLISSNEGIIFIAEDNGLFCGFITGFIMKQSKENLLEVVPTRLGEILDLYVAEEYRGKHIGSELMNKMETYLKEKGCDSIWINVSAFNENAHKFYSSYGYSNREIGLIKTIV